MYFFGLAAQAEDDRLVVGQQVIIAMGAQPDDSLAAELAGQRAEVHQIGDCSGVGYIDGAILDARKLVQALKLA